MYYGTGTRIGSSLEPVHPATPLTHHMMAFHTLTHTLAGP